MAHVAQIWRHPIKSHGREQIENVHLTAGKTLPWDRKFAVTHGKTKFSAATSCWASCRNFMIGTSTPRLAGIWAIVETDNKSLTLRHADLGRITFNPDDPTDVTRFLSWVAPLCPQDSMTPTALVSATDRGMTDSDFPSISIMNFSSHEAVANKLDGNLEHERWRGNIWLKDLPAWVEEGWIGKTLRIGTATVIVRAPVARCKHTMANPVTGERDRDTLKALRDGWGHQNFGIYAEVLSGGDVRCGDTCEVM